MVAGDAVSVAARFDGVGVGAGVGAGVGVGVGFGVADDPPAQPATKMTARNSPQSTKMVRDSLSTVRFLLNLWTAGTRAELPLLGTLERLLDCCYRQIRDSQDAPLRVSSRALSFSSFLI